MVQLQCLATHLKWRSLRAKSRAKPGLRLYGSDLSVTSRGERASGRTLISPPSKASLRWTRISARQIGTERSGPKLVTLPIHVQLVFQEKFRAWLTVGSEHRGEHIHKLKSAVTFS